MVEKKESASKKRKISSDSDSSSSSDDSDASDAESLDEVNRPTLGLGFSQLGSDTKEKKSKNKRKPISEMTDEELFVACGGLTAHK